MRPSLRASVRHARPLVAVAALASLAACSDEASITGVRPAQAPAASASPADDVTPSAVGTARGTLEPGGSYSLRTGPGTNFTKVGSAAGGTAVTVVCTSRARSTSGSTTTWARIQRNDFDHNTWVAAHFVEYAAGAATPPACDSPSVQNISAGVRGDDYPLRTATADPGCPMDGNGFCVRQCTSFVTWRLRDVNNVAFWGMYGGRAWGSAYRWRDAARALGYRVDRTPEVGSVAYFAQTATRTNGHVAWVASVSSDRQTVTIEEYNVRTRRGYGTRTLSVSSIDNFIHVY